MASSKDDVTDIKTTLGDAVSDDTRQRILGTIYGQCAGDAIGLLSEFMTKKEAKLYYKKVSKKLEYEHKTIANDGHRTMWEVGDWTDDSDQMILIMQSVLDQNGKVDINDFSKKIKKWMRNGFLELGDFVGMGQGATTSTVLSKPNFLEDPHAAAYSVWTANNCYLAPNGAVMRTSFLGIHMYTDLEQVSQNAIAICRTTHADPRCQASVVALSVAIAMLLQRQPKHVDKAGRYIVRNIIQDAYDWASKLLDTNEKKKELSFYLECKNIKELKLDEAEKIGYTYKSLGCAFWALKQDNFRKTITKIMLQGGDADSNACTAGAMLGCKLGYEQIPVTWRDKLLNKEWLDNIIKRYFDLMGWNASK